MDTIRELLYGNIHPFEREDPKKDSKGDRLVEQTIRHENTLKVKLNESEVEIFEKYKDANIRYLSVTLFRVLMLKLFLLC